MTEEKKEERVVLLGMAVKEIIVGYCSSQELIEEKFASDFSGTWKPVSFVIIAARGEKAAVRISAAISSPLKRDPKFPTAANEAGGHLKSS